ncbi:hypothetical protein FF38_09350 [Lucilia cuprina]|uniref:Uncharacterized protein n=1 Tax=Lucilia cuprina TaxID=7375 RepID=A0A0L0CR01_LUCCU|nr:hypothetical protein FF38_09350 [Lucilia cuprina]
MGSVAPKVNIKDEITNARTNIHHSMALQCPVQAYPVPFYSVAPRVDVKDRITWLDKPKGEDLNLLCPAYAIL